MDISKKGPAEGKTRKELIESLYRLSGLQQGMLFHGLYNEGKGAYSEQMLCDFVNLDIDILKESWEFIFKRHSILRTGFIHNEVSVPVQCVYREVKLPLEILDYRGMSKAEQEEALKKYEEDDRKKGFDFNTPPLIRFGLIRLSEDRYRMLWSWHHILFDGWSLPVLMEEFMNTYETLKSGKKIVLNEIDRFEDYIRYIERGNKERHEKFWSDYMKGVEQGTLLPFIGTTAQRNKGIGEYGTEVLVFDEETTSKAEAFAQKNRITVNTLMQGVWSYLLHKYTGNDDITFGAIVSGRPDDLPGVEQRVGLYINTLPLRSVINDEQGIAKWLQEIQKQQLASRQFQHTPLQDIQRLTGVSGDLFDSLLVFENYPVSEIVKANKWSLKIENVVLKERTNYPLTLMIGAAKEITINFSYNSEILRKEFVKEIRDHFENVFQQIISKKVNTAGEIKLLSKEEEDRILFEFNNTKVDNPKNKSLVDLFEEQAENSPDSIALIFEDKNLTYEELNENANKLAHYLKIKGVKADTLVPICMERGIEMITGIIAILKAGGAYVPVDPDYPAERKSFMLEDSGAALMLCSEKVKTELPDTKNTEVIVTDSGKDKSEIEKQSAKNLNEKVDPKNLTYVLYTSGSTGNPKGVRMPGSSLVNLLLWQDKQFTNKSRKVLQFTSLNFDVSFQEIFSTLCFGSTLCLISADRRIDLSEVMKDIEKNKITHLFVPYIVLKNLAEFILSGSGDTYSLEEIITAGEQLKLTKDLDKFLNNGKIKLVNQYGPTEAHVVSSYNVTGNHETTPLPPIGKPVDNTQLYILGKDDKLVPVGVTGELYIAGAQLALGYLNLPELTKEKFIKDPFSSDPDARMYRTGDLARWLPDGNIEYMGRTDDQIKIRGYRVELGEIESTLQQSDLIKQAVVLAKEDKAGNKRLISYVVANGNFEKEKIITYLRNQLPEYMVPGLWIEMDSFPVTPNGKVDKRKLPEPDISELLSVEYVAPRNETEEKLAQVWKELLGAERVGIHDNFFELGGHSLLVIRLISAIRKNFEVEINVNSVFEYPTLEALANHIQSKSGGQTLTSISVQKRPERIPLSYSQERLWFLDALEGSVQYHVPAVLRLKGKLNVEAFEYALKKIVSRHEVLRTVMLQHEGQPYQHIISEDNFKINLTDGTELRNDQTGLDKFLRQIINKPFDLSKDYMIRADLIKLSEEENVLVVTMHHIASDGWSVSILINEVMEFYGSHYEDSKEEPEPLKIQYADFSIWQRENLTDEVLEKKLDYWKNKLEDTPPLDIPTDHKRPEAQSFRGASFDFTIDKELSDQLQNLSRRHGATLFMTLLAGFKLMMNRYSGQQDICIGTVVAGRQQQELEELIGFFVNTLALRSEVNNDESFNDFLQKVKQTTIEAQEHQDVPFEKVVDTVVKERSLSRHPLFQTVFVLQNTPESENFKLGDLELSLEKTIHDTSRFELTYSMYLSENGLEGSIEYCSDLYTEQTIERMTTHFKELLSEIVKAPEQKVGSFRMLSDPEKDKLLNEFNDTAKDYPKDKTVVDFFEEQVKKSPDSIAVVFEDKKLTYKELNERANQLARYLQNKGVKEETLVPICLERSLEMITGILGILKAGAAYVPIDPEYPEDRKRFMLEDTGAAIAVTDDLNNLKISGTENIEIININTGADSDWQKISKLSKEDLKTKVKPENLAYAIYTSGSTGQPKGAMNEHRGIANRLNWAQDYFNLTAEDTVLQKTTFCFDVSVWELLWPLLAGSRLVFAKPGGEKDTWYLRSVIEKEKVTMLHFVPSMLDLFLNEIEPGECAGLKKVLCSGEALKPSHAESFMKKLPDAELHNLYGPTEAAIDVTYWSLNDNIKEGESIDIIPIGKPVANTSMYILDERNDLVPIGCIGQIHIGGVQVARGYLNRPELNYEKFISDPFSKEEGARLYKTGDLGRWLADGNIEYLGRIDDQVKIRGLRIELGEIENSLASVEGVNDAKVIISDKGSEDNKKINAYLQIDKEVLPMLGNYQYLLDIKQIKRSDLHILPDGLPILAANQNEVKFLYNEIFEDKYYLKHGISLKKDSCVIDIGANVGFFTVFLNLLSEDIKVYSFEPVPEVYNYLDANRNLYNVKGKGFQLAILDKEQDIEFVYYPGMSILSGITEDEGNVKEVVKSYIDTSESADIGSEEMESLLEAKLESVKVKCKAKTLSQIISEEKIEKIDLLKIDVENSEHLVLAGLDEKDWDRIESVIIEIHDIDGRLNRITEMLQKKGFRTFAEKEKMLSKDAVLYNLYALRNSEAKNKDSLDGISENEKLRKAGWQDPADFRKQIRAEVEKELPSYMIPSQIIFLDKFPLTSNGKLDKKALPDPDAGELTVSEYAAPRNETEENLAAIWKELLHTERIGINDNFFELGGDSMITIQILSRARRLGYELKPKDFFTHQTISKLSAVIAERTKAAVTGEQGLLTGPSGLLPIQQWYFEGAGDNVSYFNQAVLLSIEKSVTSEVLSKAVEQLIAYHDSLRFDYKIRQINQIHKIDIQDVKWEQNYGDKISELISIDLKKATTDSLGNLIKENADKIQSSLDIEKGDIAKFALMQTPEDESHNRLLIVVHHLAIDGASWRIILDDLELLISGLQKNEETDLGPKGTSYRQWYQALEQYGQSKKLLSQSNYWERITENFESMPVDKEYNGDLIPKDLDNHSMRLDAAKTQQLLQEVPGVYHTEINDILLCALALTLCEMSKSEKVIVGLEGHGRESISENITGSIDTSRTVGWFTSLYPVLLEASTDMELSSAIKSIKEQLRNVPDKGLGYGVLKYINRDEKLTQTPGKDCWDIVFNYLGQLDKIVSSSKYFSGAGESSGEFRSEKTSIREKLSVNGMIQGGELILNWTYSSRHFENDTIGKLADRYKSILESLITHCIEQLKSGQVFTPSDYGLGSEIKYEELDRFLSEPFGGKERRESVEGIYRLSGLQQGMLFHSLYDSGSGAYTEQLVCELIKPDTELVVKSWNQIIKKHSILRSGFYYDVFKVPVQCVYKDIEIPVTILDFSDIDPKDQAAALKEYAEADRQKGFDFKTVPLMRISLIKLSEDRYSMLWTSHHILFDGWSLPILMGNFLSVYEKLSEGKEPDITEVDRYEDYIRYVERIDKEQEESFWSEYMNGVEQSTLLPFIGTTTQRTKGVGLYETVSLNLDKEKTKLISSFAQKHHLTINTIYQGVWSYLLHRYTGNDNVAYGIIVSGRPTELAGIEQRVGMYINTLPLHSEMKKDKELVKWLQDLQSKQASSVQFQYTPLQEIQSLTGISGDLFDSILVFENYPISEIIESQEWKLKITNVQMQEQTNYPLTITVGSADVTGVHFSYNTEILKQEYVNGIRSHFEKVLTEIINNEELIINDIEILTEPESDRLLYGFNDTTATYPKDKNIVDLFEEQVKKTPDNIAVVLGNEKVTYRQLNERSNQLASYLQSKGVGTETLVPICIERNTDMITGIIAILKAGGVYVPVDPEYPEDRISYIIEDTNAKVVVSSIESSSKLSGAENIDIVKIDGDRTEIENQNKENLNTIIKPDNAAYIIYTSGSTGKPKGVIVQHYNVVRLLMTDPSLFDFTENDVWTMFHSFCFDFSVWEMYGALFFGGKVVMVPKETAKDAVLFSELLHSEKVTILNQIPSSFYALEESIIEKKIPLSVRYLIFGGEALDPAKLKGWKETYPDCKLINMYGITETTVHVTYQEIEQKEIEQGTSVIGKPIPTLSLYILDKDQKLLPVGIAGELCIGGEGLARGYLNRPELTSERFIQSPFSKEPGARLYRSGDLGMRLPDGNIEYLGRIDEQVKIRGYRIELGEIENALNDCESVSQAIVLAKEDKQSNKYLVAYIISKGIFDRDELINYLKGKLPEYMVPSLWVEMDSFPLASSGKINKKALPDPDAGTLISNEYVAPGNETEIKLSEIWKELLNTDRAGIHDNFFELGGHSLLAIRLISSIRRELGSEIAIKDIFQSPTIAEQAELLRTQEKGSLLPAITVQERPDLIPLSFSQERLWFIDRLEGSVQYHMPAVLRMKGELDTEALARVLKQIVNRHEVLRTVIRQEEGVGYQFVNGPEEWELNFIDGSVYKDDTEKMQRYIQQLINIPFDLSEDYMMRADLIKITEDEHILIVNMHHVASDGWSISVIVNELVELYAAYTENRESTLPSLPIQYIDYAIWQRKHLQGEIFDRKLNYWKQKLQDVGLLQLPTDFPRPAIQSTKGAVAEFSLGKELSDELLSFSQHHGATIFMTLLAAFKVLLYRYSGQQDICVGIGIAGRQSQEMENLIGFFVNTLALRSDINGQDSFNEMLDKVKVTTMEAYENQEVPFEKVVDAVVGDRDMSKNPLVQVSFVLQNTPENKQGGLGKLILSDAKHEHTTAKFDLTLFTKETPSGIEAVFEYSTDLFREDTISKMIFHFKELLNAIIKDPQQSIGKMPMLSAMEKEQLLYGFNDTYLAYTKNRNVAQLFEEQVTKTPDNTALIFGDRQLTYKELNERSNKLAHYLISKGVKIETLVPVCMDRSIDMITGILAIIKAGGAYVPIDPEYPLDRISYMLEDTGAAIVLTNKNSISKLPVSENFELIETDGEWSADNKLSTDNPGLNITTQNLVYVIYTSGSTGKPKGVLLEHSSLVNLIMWHNHVYEVTSESKTTTMAGVGFDAFGWEIWPYLSAGASILIVDDEKRLYTSELVELFNRYKITHSFMATAIIQDFISASRYKLDSMKFLLTGGDKLSSVSLEGLEYKFVNNYGPTENTVVTCNYFLSENEKYAIPPIGKPISNTNVQILSRDGELVPVGVVGEINIGGSQLARGYLNRTELTDEKFVADTFSDIPEARLYKTGDLGRWLPDGNIEFYGRLDDQVKIRGYRIELGEIESVMNKLEAVNNCCVLLRPGPGNKLVSYYVPDLNQIKEKEHELYQRQIAGWKELYDTEYSQTEEAEDVDEEFNIIGWNDSFTGGEIAPSQMKEWVDDIVEVILSEKPKRVLEIGSGTGLIYYRLAGEIEKYIGTDFSRSSMNQIQKRIDKGLRNYCETELHITAAHEIEISGDEKIDTIILNSIVQYFPGEDYMNEVIGKGITLLKGKGRIIVGDVRDNRLLEFFKGRLHIDNVSQSATLKEFKWTMEQDVLKEEELCFNPEYFYQLKSLYPEITHIEIKWKQASYINELSLYRYTAVIHVGEKREVISPEWKDWSDPEARKDADKEIEKGRGLIALKNVPNPRLSQERLLNNALEDKTVSNVGDILEALEKEDRDSTEVNELLKIAQSKKYHYRFLLDEDPLKINLLLEKEPTDAYIQQPFSQSSIAGNVRNTNIPLFNDISLMLRKDIRGKLQESLPEYMIPSDMIALNQLPLTNNGKVDRKFLSQREDLVVTNKMNYQAPATDTEIMLANIWQELLGLDRIGVHDNFFELGGHSLLGMRVISAIRRKLETELAIKDLFLYPTIAELGVHLDSQSKGSVLPAIEVMERPELIPLSFSQERLWFIDRLEGSVRYHVTAALRLKGKLNTEALAYSLQSIINRHEVLRSVMIEVDGKAYQEIRDKDQWTLHTVDGSEYENADLKENKHIKEKLQNHILELINVPFDLSEDHMIRGHLIKINELDHLLVLTMHHIASDGWSLSVMVKELVELYEAYELGRDPELEPLQIQYADYALWQRKYLQGEIYDSKLDYWREKLEGIEPLHLPTDFPRPEIQSTRGANVEFSIDRELSELLQALSKQHGATLFMTLLAAFNVMLNRYSGQEDICVGTPIAGRQQEEVEELIGFFINTLALRNEVSSSAPFTELLQKVRTTTLEAYENQEIPFEKVVETAVKQRDMNRTPLFQVMFVLQNTPDVPELNLGDIKLSNETFSNINSKFDITFFMVESPDGLMGSVEYCTDLYKENTIERMIIHFKELLRSIVADPLMKTGALPMLTKSEERKVIIEFNDTAGKYPSDKSVVELFEEQVKKTPDKTAVVFEDKKLTYKELNERANQLAHYLQSKGLKAETLIPLCIERSSELMIGILGILKAGCAYVPIDPEYPEERIKFMFNDTAGSMIISSRECAEKLPEMEKVEMIELDSDEVWKVIGKHSKENLSINLQPDNLAYIIYTSGSTGWPKGVMVTHKNIVSLVKNVSYVNIKSDDILLSTGSTSFDATTFEYWSMLLNGGQLVFCSENTLLDSQLLKEEIGAKGITMMWFTSSWFNQLIDNDITVFEKLSTVLAGGEKLSEYHIERLRQTYPEIEIINGYGPTENTTFSLTYRITETELTTAIPIGEPLNNRTAYILNKEQQPVPIGVSGEVYLGGDGISRGYLNRPELTEERYIKDPFSKEAGARLYKTGDLGRWRTDGNVDYLGRMDEQVKIRGYRIELGEIESILQDFESVQSGVVLAHETSEGSKRLVGYVVPEGEFNKESIMNYLRERLPDYMVPALWVELESFPLTKNGKIDRRALPDPEASELISNEYVAPRNDFETAMAEIWKDLLRAERVGINDNFFELGGDSIITIQVLSRARRKGYELKPKDIFINQTISSLSSAVAERTAAVVTGEQGILTGKCGLLPIQQWYFENEEKEVSYFNQSVLLSLDKTVSQEILNKAVEQLTSHHDALRFNYKIRQIDFQDVQWEQEYGDYKGELITVELNDSDKESFEKQIEEHSNKYQQSLDIEKGEIARFVLFKTPEKEAKNRLLIIVHHLAVDGVSWRILVDDLELLLTGLSKGEKADLGIKSGSYRQWYEALENYGKSKRLLSQKNYWEKAVKSYKPFKEDKEFTGVVKAKDLESSLTKLDETHTLQLLQEVPRVYHTEINDILLCALAITLCRWSSGDKIVVSMEGHGRENISEGIDTSRTVGWFTSLYPVLLEIEPERNLSDLIKGVKEQLRHIPDKGLGYGVLKYINKDEKLAGSNKDSWNIVFNYLGQLDKVVNESKWISGAGESSGAFRSEDQAVNDKLSFSAMVQGGELLMNWSYSTLHYEKETITELAEKYKSTLESLISHCVSQQGTGSVHTPSDFGLGAEVSVEELDEFLEKDDKDNIMSF